MQIPQHWPLLHFHLQLHILNAVKADLRTRCDLQTYTQYMSHSNCSGLEWKSQTAHKKRLYFEMKMWRSIARQMTALASVKHFSPNTKMPLPVQRHRICFHYLSLRVFACKMLGSAVAKTKITLIPDTYSTPVLLERSSKVSPGFWTFPIEVSVVKFQ